MITEDQIGSAELLYLLESHPVFSPRTLPQRPGTARRRVPSCPGTRPGTRPGSRAASRPGSAGPSSLRSTSVAGDFYRSHHQPVSRDPLGVSCPGQDQGVTDSALHLLLATVSVSSSFLCLLLLLLLLTPQLFFFNKRFQ